MGNVLAIIKKVLQLKNFFSVVTGNGDDPQTDPNDGRGHLGIEKLSLDRIKRNSPGK